MDIYHIDRASKKTLWILAVILLVGRCTNCENNSAITQLTEHLSEGKICDGRLINITMNIKLYTLLEVQGSQQTISTKQSLLLVWTDSVISWNPEKYDGLTVIYVSTEDICFPDIVLEQSLDTFLLPPSNVVLDVKIHHTGSIVIYYPHTYRGSCTLDIARYPFDSQTCYQSYWSTLRNIEHLNLWPMTSVGDLSGYSKNSEWELISFSTKREVYNASMPSFAGEQFVIVDYVIKMKRKPLFYILNLFLPSGLVAALAMVGFFSPSESSGVRTEKVTLGITTLLSMAILILTLSTKLPVTSDAVPLTSVFFICLMLLIAIGTVLATKSLQMVYLGINFNRTIKPRTAAILINNIGGKLGLPKQSDTRNSAMYQQTSDEGSKQSNVKGVHQANENTDNNELHILPDGTDVNEAKSEGNFHRRDNDVHYQWMYIANVFDRLMFIIFIILSACLLIWFISHS